MALYFGFIILFEQGKFELYFKWYVRGSLQ